MPVRTGSPLRLPNPDPVLFKDTAYEESPRSRSEVDVEKGSTMGVGIKEAREDTRVAGKRKDLDTFKVDGPDGHIDMDETTTTRSFLARLSFHVASCS